MPSTLGPAVIFGAGNIGRGFIGALCAQAGLPVVFVDVDEPLIAALNQRRAYTLETVFNDDVRSYAIGPVSALHARQRDEVAATIATASIVATAVGAGALRHVAPVLALGLERRRQTSAALPLNILLCENLKQAADQLRNLVLAASPTLGDLPAGTVAFVDTVIGRMVPIPTPAMRAADPSLIRVEPYCELPVDGDQTVGRLPPIPGLIAETNFARYTARKLYLHNCGHALLAYAGHALGLEYGWQALEQPVVRQLLLAGLGESRDAIAQVYGADPAWLQAHIADLVRRFGNQALGDTVFRLGRDPVRKLAASDRLVGAARTVEKAGGQPRALALGIALALCFDASDDAVAVELQAQLRREGLDRVLEQACAIHPGEPLAATIRHFYRQLQPNPAATLATLVPGGGLTVS